MTQAQVGTEAERASLRVGGQAVIEGVMMRAGQRACVAVRTAEGAIVTRDVPIPGTAARYAHIPFVRGLAALAESLTVGIDTLMWSERQSTLIPEGRRPAPKWAMLALALGAVVMMVVLLPATIAGAVPGHSPWFVVIETGVRLGVVGLYLAAVTRRPEVRRVFEYHGAEHMVVSAFEAGGDVTVERARASAIQHPRCGTSFMLAIAAVAAAVHPFLPVDPIGDRIAARLLVVPIVAAVAYEVLTAMGTLAARRPGGVAHRLLVWPQRFTTRAPDDSQLEVAIAALDGALAVVGPDAERAPSHSTGAQVPSLAVAAIRTGG